MTRSRKNKRKLRNVFLIYLLFVSFGFRSTIESLPQFSCYRLDFPDCSPHLTFEQHHTALYGINITRLCTHRVDVTDRVTSINGGRWTNEFKCVSTGVLKTKNVYSQGFVIADGRIIARDPLRNRCFCSTLLLFSF